jgi:hypothetical protein
VPTGRTIGAYAPLGSAGRAALLFISGPGRDPEINNREEYLAGLPPPRVLLRHHVILDRCDS